MAEKIIRVGVMGQGRSGFAIHVKWLREAKEQFKVVGIADLLPERHEAVAELGARGHADYHDLLADKSLGIDLIVNSLPSHLHTAGAIAALNAGYNVLSEKPFALTLADFDAMAAAAKKNDRKLFAFQNSRFQPGFRKMKEVLDSGKLGRLVHARIQASGFGRRWDWQTTQSRAGGNINNTGPHPLDHAVMLFGDRTPQVFAKLASENPYGDADNFAAVSLYGENAPLVEVIVSSFQAYPAGETFNLACTCGGLTGGNSTLKWKYFDPEKAPAHSPMHGWSDKRSYNGEQLPWVEESWTLTPVLENFQQMSRDLYNNLYDVLVRGAEPIVKLEQVRRQVGVLEQVHSQNPLPKKFA
jgi:predicted dehydrogenase